MEEVWKDINGHDFPTSASNFRHLILQDFLSSSTNKAADSSAAATTPPPTLLTLNSARELHLPNAASASVPFHGLFDQVLGPSPFEKRRAPDLDAMNPGDRRQKRMIKNRESAARSRARKQAHALELELEVKHLSHENAILKRQQEELQAAMAAQVPRKYRLQRTSTAPF